MKKVQARQIVEQAVREMVEQRSSDLQDALAASTSEADNHGDERSTFVEDVDASLINISNTEDGDNHIDIISTNQSEKIRNKVVSANPIKESNNNAKTVYDSEPQLGPGIKSARSIKLVL